MTRSHQRASPHEIMRLRVPLPTGSEQRRIAVFLDSEVAKLQALRTGYLKSGQLARERDLAVIRSQLVDADGCSTGASLSWPPAHPVHWRVTPLRYLSRIQRGASPRPIDDPKYFDDQGSHAWVRIADVSASRKYLTGTTQRLSVLGKSLSVALEPGELFVSIAASVGKPIITTIPCCIHDGFVAIRRLVGLDVEFVYYLLLLGDMFRGLGKLGTQLNLNSDTIGSIKMPVPPMVEQQELVRRFRANSEWTSSMQAMVERQLRTLDERLQSVITAAVTGQIDVSTARGVSV